MMLNAPIVYQQTEIESVTNNDIRFYQLLNSLPGAVYTCDAEGYITQYNPACVELWGCTPELGVTRWTGAVKIFNAAGNEIETSMCPMAIAIKEGRPVEAEIIIERPDGSRRNLKPNPMPLFDKEGRVTGAINMLQDITPYKVQEEKALMLAAIVESSEDAIVSKTIEGIVTSWNNGAERIFGYTAEEMIGQPIYKVIPPDRQQEEPAILKRLRKGERVDHFETKRMTKEGRIIDISLTISPLKDKTGRVIGASKIARDVTRQKALENDIKEGLEKLVTVRTTELSNANTELAKKNSELEQFAYVASHDLQEPLRKIQTFADRLQYMGKDVLTEDLDGMLQRIVKSADKMSNLIKNLLNYARVSRTEQEFTDTDLNEIVQSVLDDLDAAITRKNAVVCVDTLPVITALPLQMAQLFYNLLNNSLKFTAEGVQPQISITCEQLDVFEVQKLKLNVSNSYYRFSIKDNGIGFNSNYAERIFTIFQRLNDKESYPGTGIGLALCKKVIDNHKGSIYAESMEQNGATFTVILPAKHL